MSEVRYVTECPYCGAGPWQRVHQHIRLKHGRQAADVRSEFDWPASRVRLTDAAECARLRRDNLDRIADGVVTVWTGDPRRHRRWAHAVLTEVAAGPGFRRRLERRWRVSEHAVMARIRTLRLLGLLPAGSLRQKPARCMRGHSDWVAVPGGRRCRTCHALGERRRRQQRAAR